MRLYRAAYSYVLARLALAFAFKQQVPELTISYEHAAEVILDNLSKNGRFFCRRVGVALPAGLRNYKKDDVLYYRMGTTQEDMEQCCLRQKTQMMTVSIETKPAFKAGQPHMLFEGPYFESGHDIAITPNGKAFILIRESDTQTGPRTIEVVVNWPEELKQRARLEN